MGAAERVYYSLEEYLHLEASSEERLEYLDGCIVAMAGGTKLHSQIGLNAGRALSEGLDQTNCIVYSSDLKVKVDKANSYLYPDITVVCGQDEPSEAYMVSSPMLIVEVLSESSERYDRGEKFALYRKLPSLKQYIMISQHTPWVETFFKNEEDVWVYSDAQGLDASLYLQSMGFSLNLADIYRKVSFEDKPASN